MENLEKSDDANHRDVPRLNPEGESSAPKRHGALLLFWYLRMFFTLGMAAAATATLWYQFINKLLPLEVPIGRGGVRLPFNPEAVQWALSVLIVVAPTYFICASIIRAAIKKHEVVLQRGVRQWTSYVFLFLVSAIAIGDLITVLRYVINGDYTLRFMLKSATILLLTGWILFYLIKDLRSSDALSRSFLPLTMGLISGLVMMASVVGGFAMIDSPMLARKKSFDARRVSDLRGIQTAVHAYYRLNGELPQTLEDLLEARTIMNLTIRDPMTGEVYSYRLLEGDQFEVCAIFVTDNRDDARPIPLRGPSGQLFLHGVGEACFRENASPQRGRPPGRLPGGVPFQAPGRP